MAQQSVVSEADPSQDGAYFMAASRALLFPVGTPLAKMLSSGFSKSASEVVAQS